MIPYVHIRFIAPKREPAKVPTYGHDLSCEMNTLPVNWASAHRRTERRSQRHAQGYDSPALRSARVLQKVALSSVTRVSCWSRNRAVK